MAADWPQVRLGDVVELISGFPFASARYSDDQGGVRLLRGDNVVQGAIRWDGVKRWPADATGGLEAYWLKRGDIVLAMDRPWIEAGLKYAAIEDADLPALLVQRVSRLRGTDRLLTGYLKYVIGSRAFTDHVLSLQTGTAVPHISGGQIRAFTFSLPGIEEQAAVTEVLGALDEKMSANRTAIQIATDFSRQLLSAAASKAPHVPLSDISIVAKGVQDPAALGETLIRHYSIPALDGGGPELVAGSVVKSNKAPLPATCVIVSRLNPTIPRSFYISHDGSHPALASTEFAVLTPKGDIDTEAIYAACSQPDFFVALASKVTGTSTSHQRVRPADVLATTVLDPRALAGDQRMLLRDAIRLADQLRQETDELLAAREALMPDLLSGRMRVRPTVEGTLE